MGNEKKQYVRDIGCYYKLEGEKRLELGYQEGADRLCIVIGKRRLLWMENIDATYLYLILWSKNAYNRRIISEYKKIELEKVEDYYVMDVPKLLMEHQLTYEERDSKDFQRIKRLKSQIWIRELSSKEIYPYAYVQDRNEGPSMIEAYYARNACYIGDVEISSIRGNSLFDNPQLRAFVKGSAEEKICMDLQAFKQLLEDCQDMETLRIHWSTKNYVLLYDKAWYYHAWFHCDGEEREIKVKLNNNARERAFVFGYIQCKEYSDYQKLESKRKLLGV